MMFEEGYEDYWMGHGPCHPENDDYMDGWQAALEEDSE